MCSKGKKKLLGQDDKCVDGGEGFFFWIMEGEGSLKFRQVAVVQCDDEAIVLRFERERVI